MHREKMDKTCFMSLTQLGRKNETGVFLGNLVILFMVLCNLFYATVMFWIKTLYQLQ